VYEVLTHPGLSDNHANLLKHLAANARLNNDFDEDIAFRAVCRTHSISDAQLRMCTSIFDNARYENNLNDLRIFLEVLENPASVRA
jgi:hypothetical protein